MKILNLKQIKACVEDLSAAGRCDHGAKGALGIVRRLCANP